MLSYNKSLKQLSGNLIINMTDAERLLWSKLRSRQLKGFQFYGQKITGAGIPVVRFSDREVLKNLDSVLE